MSLHVICFDLDDTLLDTSHWLIPQALVDSVRAMQEAGWPGTAEEAIAFKANYKSPPETFFFELAQLKTSDKIQIRQWGEIGTHHFYHRNIPSPLPLIPGAHDLLQHLKKKYHIYLVTSGDPKTQKAKVKALGIQDDFVECLYVEAREHESKLEAFKAILAKEKIKPHEMLSIGNRLDHEIELAKRLGAQTCWVQHGEHGAAQPRHPLQIPDYKVTRLQDIIEKCNI